MKTSSKVVVIFMVCQLLILLGSPLGYRSGLFDVMTALGGFTMAFAGGLLTLVAVVGLALYGLLKRQSIDRGALLVAALMALVPVVFVLPQLQQAGEVPAIHDITTNPMDPPEFDEIKKRRVHAANDLVYAANNLSAEETGKLQDAAYPNLTTLLTSRTLTESVERTESVLRNMGLEIIQVNADAGLVEATATTYWFEFKDDVAVRIRSEGEQTLVDVRSVSRVGQSDLGVNAARIATFLQQFQDGGE